jgi:short-subunit dehydrogenase
MSNYHASQAYVLHFSEGLREELKEDGVSVSVLCPGPMRSAYLCSAQMDSAAPVHDKRLISAEEVALITLKALEQNRAIIIPGWRNRLLAMAPRLAPRWLVRKVAARRNRPLSRR